MKTCFSKGKLTKQFSTLPPFKRILPFHDPLFVQISKTEKPHLILGWGGGGGGGEGNYGESLLYIMETQLCFFFNLLQKWLLHLYNNCIYILVLLRPMISLHNLIVNYFIHLVIFEVFHKTDDTWRSWA